MLLGNVVGRSGRVIVSLVCDNILFEDNKWKMLRSKATKCSMEDGDKNEEFATRFNYPMM